MSAATPVVLHPAAEQELIAAARWYEERAGLGSDLIDEVLAARVAAGEHFEALTPVPGAPAGVRMANVRRFPYYLVCFGLEDRALVLAVAHVRRRPLYWKRRLEG